HTAIFTVIVLPFRVIAIVLLLFMAWILACIGLMGLTEKELRQQPITGWRRERDTSSCIYMYRAYIIRAFPALTIGSVFLPELYRHCINKPLPRSGQLVHYRIHLITSTRTSSDIAKTIFPTYYLFLGVAFFHSLECLNCV
ncbi:hypothetical protein L9F63_013644, partial [Diploptera punctata]